MTIIIGKPTIKTTQICKTCRHCVIEPYGIYKCKKFGYKNVTDGTIEFKDAYKCRQDSTKCDMSGKYYIYEKDYKIKELKAKFIEFAPFSTVFSLFIMLFCKGLS